MYCRSNYDALVPAQEKPQPIGSVDGANADALARAGVEWERAGIALRADLDLQIKSLLISSGRPD